MHIRICARKHEAGWVDARIYPEAHARIGGGVRRRTGIDTDEADTQGSDPCWGEDVTVPFVLTDDERAQLLANGHARATSPDFDPMPVVKLFTPDAHAIWLLAALDPIDGDTAWGLCDVGIGMPELNTVRLSDLASIVGPRNQPVLHDRYFRAIHPLSAYTRRAKRHGSILD